MAIVQEHRVKAASITLLWRLFAVLVALQVADLTTTYWGIAGGAREGNIFLRGAHLTPLALILKAFALTFFASLILGSSKRGRPTPRRLLIAESGIVAVYVAVVLNNTIVLVAR